MVIVLYDNVISCFGTPRNSRFRITCITPERKTSMASVVCLYGFLTASRCYQAMGAIQARQIDYEDVNKN
jgi:hypothetical protein